MSSPPLPKRLKMSQPDHLPPPPIQGPSAKERKYDRQLRLWAATGQAALEDAHLLLINTGSGVVGVETLKNLVLPGIGQFSILDPAIVSEADLGVNFFLDESDLGKSRAHGSTRLLNELNPDVQGHALTEPFETFLSRPESLNAYTHILVVLPLQPEFLDIIAAHGAHNLKPIFYIHSTGFYAHFSLSLPPAFPIVDTHPDPSTTSDLRLLEPWPELSSFAASATHNLESMDDETHGHIPYVLILLRALEDWKSTHNGTPPSSYSDKTSFRKQVQAMTRTNNPEGGEENFEEAVGAVLKSISRHTVSSAVQQVLEAPETQNLTPTSNDFFVIAHAISLFYKEFGQLPLSGGLPDMKAKSADYIALQTIYKTKARDDVANITSRVRQLESQLGRSKTIDSREIEAFCKSAAHVKLIRGKPTIFARPGEIPRFEDKELSQTAISQLVDPITQTPSQLLIYLVFLAYDSYTASHSLAANTQIAAPPADDYQVSSSKIAGIAHTILDALIKSGDTRVEEPEYGMIVDELGKIAQEMVRADGGELHNISALAAGMVAQEVIKIITEQYVPVDNICVFDGIASKAGVYRL